VFADQLANVITNVLIPAIDLITALSAGDASAAWQAFKDLIGGVAVRHRHHQEHALRHRLHPGALVSLIGSLPGRIFAVPPSSAAACSTSPAPYGTASAGQSHPVSARLSPSSAGYLAACLPPPCRLWPPDAERLPLRASALLRAVREKLTDAVTAWRRSCPAA
jgi:hypothetical protein